MNILVDAYSTLRTAPELGFAHRLLNHGTPEVDAFDEHLQSLLTYIMSRGADTVTATKYAIFRHIQRTKHHFALALAEVDMECFGEWADEANAIYLLSDGSLRDSYARVLIGKDGSVDPAAEIPYPLDARARKARVDALMEGWGIFVPSHLPPVVGEAEAEMCSAEEIARRALALFLVVRRAESLLNDDPMPASELERGSPIAYGALSPNEREFITNPSPSQQEIVDLRWRLEALHLLLWAMGMALELPFPSDLCPLPDLAACMTSISERDFVARARMRPTSSILDALDMHFRFHWATVEEHLRGEPEKFGPWRDVVPERHHALNWLIRFEDAEWDDVSTPT